MVGSAIILSPEEQKFLHVLSPLKASLGTRITESATSLAIMGVFLIFALNVVYIFNNDPGLSITDFLKSSGHKIVKVFLEIGKTKSSLITCSLIGVGLLGGGVVILRVTTMDWAIKFSKEEEPISMKAGKYTDLSHYLRAEIRWQHKKEVFSRTDAIVDSSTLDNGNGWAPVYENQGPIAHTMISLTALVSAVPYTALVIAYNLLRVVLIGPYIFARWAYQKMTDEVIVSDKEYNFSLGQIPKEVAFSVWRVVQAPFYGIAFAFSAIYCLTAAVGLGDKRNARKLMAQIEIAWNYNQNEKASATIWRGRAAMWPCETMGYGWEWEGGGRPAHLGVNVAIGVPCRQPIAWVQFANHEIIDIRSQDFHKSCAIAIESNKGTLTSKDGAKFGVYENLENRSTTTDKKAADPLFNMIAPSA